MSIRVCAVNFWPGFSLRGSILGYMLARAGYARYECTDNVDEADLIFTSVFGRRATEPRKTIFYTGENVRPDFLKCRYALTFDRDAWGGRNFYFPLWMARLCWPDYRPYRAEGANSAHGWEALIDPQILTRPRARQDDLDAKKFCAVVASAYEGLRVSLAAALNNYRSVDARGPLFGAPLQQSKHDFFGAYKFALCPENSLFPGYVTEKLFDAWVGGAVPIYFGGSQADPTINSQAFVNYADTHDVASLVGQVVDLDRSAAAYLKMHAQPLLLEAPDIRPAISFIRGAVDDICRS